MTGKDIVACFGAAGLLAMLLLAAGWSVPETRAASPDPLEPQVLVGEDAMAIAAALGLRDRGTAWRITADVAVILFEPGGFVRVVLVDISAGRKVWTLLTGEGFAKMLDALGEQT